MSLSRDVDGYIWHMEHDDPGAPVRLDDWQDYTGVKGALDIHNNQWIRLSDNSGGWDSPGWIYAHNLVIGDHTGEIMVIAHMKAQDSEPARDVVLPPEVGLFLRTDYGTLYSHPSITTPERLYGRAVWDEAPGGDRDDELVLGEKDAGAGTFVTIHNTGIFAGRDGEVAWHSVWADGAGKAALWDDFHDVTIEEVSGAVRSSGLVGFGISVRKVKDSSTHQTLIDRLFALKGRYLTINGVPTGWRAELRKSDDTVLDDVSESGGSIQFDMLGITEGDVNPKEASRLAFFDDLGTLRQTHDA